jgi:O-antigen ligase
MFGIELYYIFIAFTLVIVGIAIGYLSINNLRLLVIPFSLSTFIASIFFTNEPIWISGEIEAGIGSYLRAGFLIFSGGVAILYYLRNIRIHKFRIPLHLILLFIFIFFSILSTFYTIDFKATLTRSSLFLALAFSLLGMDFWLDSNDKLKKFLNTIFYLLAIILILNLISMVAIPSRSWWWKTPSRLLGILSHPNELGGLCMVSFPIIFWKLNNTIGNSKYLVWLVALINTIVLIATGSRTSLIVSILGFIIWFIVHKDWIKLATLGAILTIGIIIISQVGFPSYSRNEGSKITDLTERELIWEGVSVFLEEKPILGYGYAVEGKIFDNQLLFDMEGQFFNPNSQQPLHNGYLSIFIGGGLVGLSIWMIAILLPVYFLLKSKVELSFKAYALATIIPILIANVVESALTGYLSATDIYFWLAWLVAGKVVRISDNSYNSKIALDEVK